MNTKNQVKLIILVAFIIGAIVLVSTNIHKNDDQNWQVVQSVTGDVMIKDRPGWYIKLFASVWTYPRAISEFYSMSDKEGGKTDESIQVTFNDGGQAKISSQVRFQLPTNKEQRRKLHQDFNGNPENIKDAVRAHLVNVMKATAPLMSASDNQSARKAEFTQLVEMQLQEGLFEMERIGRIEKDETDDLGKAIMVYTTEVVYNQQEVKKKKFDSAGNVVKDENGNDVIITTLVNTSPKIIKESPLKQYGIVVLQFSVTGTHYDAKTRELFTAKKEASLMGEKSKVEREKEVQERLMIEEKGKRQKAEVEAVALKEKAEATIRADKEYEVAEINAKMKVEVERQSMLQAEVLKNKELAIAEMEKKIAIVDAQRKLDVAEIELETAKAKSEAMIKIAEAKEIEVKKTGAITELEEKQLEYYTKAIIGASEHLAKIHVPSIIIAGGGEAGNTAGIQDSMMNLAMMKYLGIMTSDDQIKLLPDQRKFDRRSTGDLVDKKAKELTEKTVAKK